MTAPEPTRPDGDDSDQGLQHRPSETSQRKADPIQFPHGYEPRAAAWMLHELLCSIEQVSGGNVTPEERDIQPMMQAGQALAHTLETADLKGIEA